MFVGVAVAWIWLSVEVADDRKYGFWRSAFPWRITLLSHPFHGDIAPLPPGAKHCSIMIATLLVAGRGTPVGLILAVASHLTGGKVGCGRLHAPRIAGPARCAVRGAIMLRPARPISIRGFRVS